MKIEITSVILTGGKRYERPLHSNNFHTSIRHIFATMPQLESEQWLCQKGYVEIKPRKSSLADNCATVGIE